MYRRTKDVLYHDLDQETVLLSLDKGEYFSLNPTGAFLWRQLSSEQTLEHLCAAAAAEFGVETEKVEGDIRSFLADMSEAGLLHEVTLETPVGISSAAGK